MKTFCLELSGDFACFTRPEMKAERVSYDVITPSAARAGSPMKPDTRTKNRWLDDGRHELSIPYSNDKELIMDILKYGADVEVIAPEALREAVKNQINAAASQYQCGKETGPGFGPEH